MQFTFAIVFSLARMVGGPYLLYVTVMEDNNPLLIKVIFMIVSTKETYFCCFFFFLIGEVYYALPSYVVNNGWICIFSSVI